MWVAFTRLAVVFVAGVVAAILTNALGVLVVVLALVAMVMAHELGHFATAKWSRMKVTEYFFGFGPRLWS
ncbi:MAG: site-2 protease family protein, partial [Acidimicrobiales bacterium]